MLRDPLFLLAAFAALVVAAILIFGIGTFAKGGDFNRRNANKIMRWRLIAQFIAVILLVAFAWFRHSGS
ncbi:twin transmembrane helix small protein [Paracoccus sp. IB05]|uniref:twin transmembrane helix small protein n=1 Tax=Paracoccus sp. IB05 TaxID=2779367 RepID=UPI0018E7A83B|nr:twin transmembrane helix small protein [Paracoccus sp. IB05]MBJ2152568.1 twin transmembrane helix small protein [Paracoccus sp. IB05]